MNTTRYRFPDEATAIAALSEYHDADGWITGGHTFALLVIGTMYTPAVTDPATGDVTTPAQPLPGWHADLTLASGDAPAAAQAYVITPSSPSYVMFVERGPT